MTDDRSRSTSAPITGLSHVQLLVADITASAEWYGAALGLERYVENLDRGYIALRHPSSGVGVVLTNRPVAATGASGSSPPTNGATVPGSGAILDHLAFAVPDGESLRSWADHLTTIGIDHRGVAAETGGLSLHLFDLDGTDIELVAPGPGPGIPQPAPG